VATNTIFPLSGSGELEFENISNLERERPLIWRRNLIPANYHFSFTYPKDYTIQVADAFAANRNTHQVVVGKYIDRGLVGGVIMVSDKPAGMTVDNVIDNWHTNDKSGFTNFQSISDSRITMDNTDAYRMEYTAYKKGPRHYISVIVFKNNNQYSALFLDETDHFLQEQKNFDTILSSIKFS
jgi:hypothetical protein